MPSAKSCSIQSAAKSPRVHVAEDRSGRGRRHVGRTVLGAEQEDRHLRPRHARGGAVVASAASGGDAVPDDRLDGRVVGARLRNVEEVGEPALGEHRRRVARVRHDDVVERARGASGRRRADPGRARHARGRVDAADRDRRSRLELIADDVDRRSAGRRARGPVHVPDLKRRVGRRDARGQQSEGRENRRGRARGASREQSGNGVWERGSVSHRRCSFLRAVQFRCVVGVVEFYSGHARAMGDLRHTTRARGLQDGSRGYDAVILRATDRAGRRRTVRPRARRLAVGTVFRGAGCAHNPSRRLRQ